AATKTFASQQLALALLAFALGDGPTRGELEALRDIPGQVQTILDTTDARAVAEAYADADAYFFIGRGYHYPVALEGALKMKEITYRHAEGFAAGELKHGPLALVTENTPVFAIVTGDGETARKTIGNVKEVEARDAPVVAITDGESDVTRYADHALGIPAVGDLGGSVLANVQLQLVAYWVANLLGRSIDKPRNLAKSVTVE
ncbi:SIS domain-containing protein, partial [Natrinema soli]